jgi:large subunit ribosomal protein L4
MPEVQHFSAAAEPKGTYALPVEFDGPVNEAALYHAVRVFRANQRQGTHSTLTRSEVSGGNQKPWRQKGTGRARQGTIRAAHWRGGGVVFGPKPRSYRLELPRQVKRLARQSALNARARDGQLVVIEPLAFDAPKTKRMAGLVAGMDLAGRKVLVLTSELRPAVYLSGRNIPDLTVMRYRDASAYDILWADAVVVEESALGGHVVPGAPKRTGRATRARKAVEGTTAKKTGGRAVAKRRAAPKAKAAAKTKTAKAAPKRTKAAKSTKSKPKKGGGNA